MIRAIRIVAAAVAILMIGGCYLPRPHTDWATFSADDAVGSWCGQAGDLLTLTEDNEFLWAQMSEDVYKKLMTRYNPGGREYDNSVSGSGRWEIRKFSGTVQLELGFEVLDGASVDFGTGLLAGKRRQDEQGVLLYFRSDPDLRPDHEFTRCDKP